MNANERKKKPYLACCLSLRSFAFICGQYFLFLKFCAFFAAKLFLYVPVTNTQVLVLAISCSSFSATAPLAMTCCAFFTPSANDAVNPAA